MFEPGYTYGDLDWIAEHLRTADVEEILASDGVSPKEAIRRSAGASAQVWIVRPPTGKNPVAVCGVAPLGPDYGSPWLLATDGLRGVARSFLKESPSIVGKMLEFRPKLLNFVDARNMVSLKWLKWLGFTIYPAEPYGFAQLPFHRVVKER